MTGFCSAYVMRSMEGVVRAQYSPNDPIQGPSYAFLSLVSSKSVSLDNCYVVGAQLSGLANTSGTLTLGIRLLDSGRCLC